MAVSRFCEASPVFDVACGQGVKLLLHPGDGELLSQERPCQTRTHSSRVHEDLLTSCQWSSVYRCKHFLESGNNVRSGTDMMASNLDI